MTKEYFNYVLSTLKLTYPNGFDRYQIEEISRIFLYTLHMHNT